MVKQLFHGSVHQFLVYYNRGYFLWYTQNLNILYLQLIPCPAAFLCDYSSGKNYTTFFQWYQDMFRYNALHHISFCSQQYKRKTFHFANFIYTAVNLYCFPDMCSQFLCFHSACHNISTYIFHSNYILSQTPIYCFYLFQQNSLSIRTSSLCPIRSPSFTFLYSYGKFLKGYQNKRYAAAYLAIKNHTSKVFTFTNVVYLFIFHIGTTRLALVPMKSHRYKRYLSSSLFSSKN